MSDEEAFRLMSSCRTCGFVEVSRAAVDSDPFGAPRRLAQQVEWMLRDHIRDGHPQPE